MTSKSDLKKRIRARQSRTGESYTTARMHVLAARELAADDDVGLTAIVLKCNDSSLRIRPRDEEAAVTLRCSSYQASSIAPGQLIDVTLAKRWTFRGDAYASGSIDGVWTDVAALGLTPLRLEPVGTHDPRELYGADDMTRPQPAFEFEDLAWSEAIVEGNDYRDESLVEEAAELADWDPLGARTLLMQALLLDIRCIAAHVELGRLAWKSPKEALTHFEIAVAIGDLSLGENFEGVLPWGLINNRPFLRALHASGLCLWRLERRDEALRVFTRCYGFEPSDPLGVRFCVNDVMEGIPWSPEPGEAGWEASG